MDNGKLTGLILLDLSAAFDTVIIDLYILLQRLSQPFCGLVCLCQTNTKELT